MLIVCTGDPDVVATAQDPRSGSGQWGRLVIIDDRYNQSQATSAIETALRGLGSTEPLCFSAHGNDTVIGDDEGYLGKRPWRWRCAELALMLESSAAGFRGPILIHACANTVANYAAGLAVALENIRALRGVWIYGFNRAVGATSGYPPPAKLSSNRELQGSQVSYRLVAGEAEAEAEAACAPALIPHGDGYRAVFPSGHAVEIPRGFDPAELARLLGLMGVSPAR